MAGSISSISSRPNIPSLPRVGIQTGDGNARMIDPQFPHGILSQADHAVNPLLFHTVARLPEGDMRGDVDHPEIFVRQQHRIVTGIRQIGVDFRMPGIVKSGPVDGLLVDGPRHRRVDLPGHRQFDHLPDIFEGGASRLRGNRLVPYLAGIDILHVQHIHDAAPIEPSPGADTG